MFAYTFSTGFLLVLKQGIHYTSFVYTVHTIPGSSPNKLTFAGFIKADRLLHMLAGFVYCKYYPRF